MWVGKAHSLLGWEILDFRPGRSTVEQMFNEANRSFPGADIGSDLDLVLSIIKLKLKTKRSTKNPRIRFDLEKLKDPKIAEVFHA